LLLSATGLERQRRGGRAAEIAAGLREDRQVQAQILRAGLEHLDYLVPLFNAYREFYQQAPDLDGARQFLHDRLLQGEAVIFLALKGNEEQEIGIGFTQLYPSFSSVAMRPIWILNDLFVSPGFRRGGVARRLLEAARELAMATHAARLTLATARGNTGAKALYESMGYWPDQAFDHYDLSL
jgi:GNAT superfamily N-acetyltransferase